MTQISIFWVLSPTCPKGARITDTNTFYGGNGSSGSVLHGLDFSGGNSRALARQSLPDVRASTTREPRQGLVRATRSRVIVHRLASAVIVFGNKPWIYKRKSGAAKDFLEVRSILFLTETFSRVVFVCFANERVAFIEVVSIGKVFSLPECCCTPRCLPRRSAHAKM